MSNALCRVSGPIHHYVTLGTTTYYLGTAEDTPEYEETFHSQAIMNALAGGTLPFQETYDGSSFVVKSVLTRYDEAVLSLMRQPPPRGLTPMGQEHRLSRGSLLYGNWSTQLVMQASFFGTANAQPDDLPGYRFLYAQLRGTVPTQGGTKGTRIGVVWECKSVYNTTTRGFDCFTTDAAIAALVPN